MTETERFCWLPPVLKAIAEAGGLDAALAIAERHGGRRVLLPRRVEGRNWLVETVGQEPARKILERFGPGRLDIPLGPAGSYSRMRRRINERYDELERRGASAAEIAADLGITERTVRLRRASRRALAKSAQKSLF